MIKHLYSLHKVLFKGLVLTLLPALILINTPLISLQADPLTALELMPAPGTMVSLTSKFDPAYLKGMVINLKDPFKFEFIVYRGDEKLSVQDKHAEYSKLIKYFLAAMAVADTDQWVNLSPYEKDRVIPQDFGMTLMGRDLLAQDYLLKQISSSLTNPDTGLGKKFWNKVYKRAYDQFGTTDIPINTFNKVWIIPDKALIYEKDNTVYVLKDHLKVMTEADYLSMRKHGEAKNISDQVTREIIIPAIEKEVNEGKSFAPLRQVFSAMLLATWYKMALKESILTKLYVNSKKVKGVDQNPKNNEWIYTQYLRAFKKGAYNMIREDVDQSSRQTIVRQYFSGGSRNDFAMQGVIERTGLAQASKDFVQNASMLDRVEATMKRIIRHSSPTGLALTGAVLGTIAVNTANAQIIPTVTTHQTVSLSWNPPTNGAVASYNFYLKNTLTNFSTLNYTKKINTGSSNNSYNLALMPGTNFIFVTAVGPQGNESLPANPTIEIISQPFSPVKITSQIEQGTKEIVLSGSYNTNLMTNIVPNGMLAVMANSDLSNPKGWHAIYYTGLTANGSYSVKVPVDPSKPEEFFRLRYPAPPPAKLFTSPLTSTFSNVQGTPEMVLSGTYNPNLLLTGPTNEVAILANSDLSNTNGWHPIGYLGLTASGEFEYPIPIDPNKPAEFFRLQYPVAVPTNEPATFVMSNNLHIVNGHVSGSFYFSGFSPVVNTAVIQTNSDLKNPDGWNTIGVPIDLGAPGPYNFDEEIPTNAPYLFFRVKGTSPLGAVYSPVKNNEVAVNGLDLNGDQTKGGIDLNSNNMQLQIKRDGKGVSLAVDQENYENIHFDGLIPIILNIRPVSRKVYFLV